MPILDNQLLKISLFFRLLTIPYYSLDIGDGFVQSLDKCEGILKALPPMLIDFRDNWARFLKNYKKSHHTGKFVYVFFFKHVLYKMEKWRRSLIFFVVFSDRESGRSTPVAAEITPRIAVNHAPEWTYLVSGFRHSLIQIPP